MAGFYPDVPNHRIAYDRDGTVVLTSSDNTFFSAVGSGTISQLNDETQQNTLWAGDGANLQLVLMFPRAMDISHMYLRHTKPSQTTLEVSSDTTNGGDGTWTNIGNWSNGGNTKASMRNNINALTGATSITGLKVWYGASGSGTSTGYLRKIHLYGAPSVDPVNKLEIWHPTLDQRLGPADLDWGDDPQGHVEVAQFRLKNLSSSETAQSVELSREALTDTTFQDAHQFSADDTTYTDTLGIGDLGPGVISPVLYVRHTYPTSHPLNLHWARIIATAAGGWA